MNRDRRTTWLGTGAGVLALGVSALLLVSASTGRGEAGGPADTASGTEVVDGTDAHAGHADGAIRLTREQIARFGITFGEAAERPLVRTVRSVGMVEFDETGMAYVSPRFGGWVERLHVDFTGQEVRAGQPLMDVYSPELVAAQEDLLLAARMVDEVGGSRVEGVTRGAEDLLESARRRLRYWDVSEPQIRRILEEGEVRRTLTIHAPVSGVVMEKEVFRGQAFRPGQNLYMIADLSRVWVNVEVFEADVPFVREGMPAEVRIQAVPGRTYLGHIDYVHPTLQERTRSMRARIVIHNPRGEIELRPGMYATAELVADRGSVLTVPSSALLHTGRRTVAFVDMGEGRLMPHEVTPGARGGDLVEILDGLEAGQRVVTSAQFLLDSESNLAEVMQAMMAEMGISGEDDMEGMDMDGSGGTDMEGSGGTDMEGSTEMEMPSPAGGGPSGPTTTDHGGH